MNYDQLCEIIKDVIPQSKEVFPDSKIVSDLGICSFDMMLLLFRIEDMMDVQIDTSLLKKDMTVNEILNVINEV